VRAADLTLSLSYALAALAAGAVLLTPIPAAYALLMAVAWGVGLFLDLRRRVLVPRLVLTLVGVAGFVATLVPFSRETLAEQSLAALTILFTVKLLERKERRDHFQILALALMVTAAGASLAPEMAFGFLFLADLLLGILLLLWLPFGETLGEGRVGGPLLRSLAKVAAGLAAASVPLTVVIFVVMPRSANPFWIGFAPRPQPVSGFSDRLTLGQVGRISASQATAFRVELEGIAGPLPETPYWRGIVMEVTDGVGWRTAPEGGVAIPVRLGGTTVRATYYVEPHGERELFLLEQPTSAMGGFRILPLNPARVVRLPAPLTKPIRYQGFSLPGDRRNEPLGAATRERNTSLPPDFSPAVRDLAQRLTRGLEDDGARARALADHFAAGFTYSLEVPAPSPGPGGAGGGNPLEQFLLVHRTGYCEYYAAALAVMLRSVGIPARVVTGYLGGDFNRDGNYYLVRQSSAHAWVEAWIRGTGWLRMDPTPASEEGATLAARRSARPRLWLDSLRMKWNSWVVQYDTETQVGFLRSTRRRLEHLASLRPGRGLWTLGGVLLAVLVLAACLPALRARFRSADRLERVYRRFLRHARRRGLERHPWEGPLAHAQRVAEAWPGVGREVRELAADYARVRYRGDPATPDLLERAAFLVGVIRRAG
jgi:transglutaminase-like putative cysteine protease